MWVDGIKIVMDPYEFTKTVKALFKVKALFQRQIALKRVQKMTEDQQQTKQKIVQSDDKEGLALKEFVLQLKAKGITAEAFFRICDISYSQAVPIETMKEQISKFGIKLSNTQISRLFLLLDEDFTGTVSLEEYQDALQVYQLAAEKHFLTSNKEGKPFQLAQNKALEALTDLMAYKDMSSGQLFDFIDSDYSNFISPEELKKAVMTIHDKLTLKNAKGIQTYFEQFDVNQNGKIEREEFIAMFKRINRIVDKKKEADKAVSEITESTLKSSLSIAFSGFPIKHFYNICMDYAQNANTLATIHFLLLLSNAYPTASPNQAKQFLQEIKENDKEISLPLLLIVANQSPNTKVPKGQELLSLIANTMYSVDSKLTNTKNADPGQIIEESFTRFMTIINFRDAKFTKDKYRKMTQEVIKLRSSYSDLIFDECFQKQQDGSVLLPEIKAKTKSALTNVTSFQSKPANVKPIEQIVPGFNTLSPNEQADASVTKLIKELKKANIKPSQIFQTASASTDSARVIKIKETFKKLLPGVNESLVDSACSSFGSNDVIVSRAIFCNTFDEKIDTQFANQSPQKTVQAVPIGPREADVLLRKLEGALSKQKISYQAAFRKADVTGQGLVTAQQLKAALQVFLQDENDIKPAEFKSVMLCFDSNQNGLIDEKEFIATLEKVRPKGKKRVEINNEVEVSGDQSLPAKPGKVITQPQRQDVKPQPAKQDLKAPKTATELVAVLEKELGCDIQNVMLDLITQSQIPVYQFTRAFQRQKADVTIPYVQHFCLMASNTTKMPTTLMVRDLVRFICKCDNKFDGDKFLRLFAAKFQGDVREKLSQIFEDEAEITKDMFVNQFASEFGEKEISKWNIICLFYLIDEEDHLDDVIHFETLVKKVSEYKPSAPVKKGIEQPVKKIAGTPAKQITKAPGLQKRKTFLEKDVKWYTATVGLTELQDKDREGLEVPLEPSDDDLHIDSDKVMTFLHAYVVLQKKLVSKEVLDQTLIQLIKFKETNKDGSDEEFLATKLKEAMKSVEQQHVDHEEEISALKVRFAFLHLKDENGECIFDLFQLMQLAVLVIDRNKINTLGVDEMYLEHLIDVPDKEDEQALKEYFDEAWTRLQRRLILAESLLTAAQKADEKNEPFDITDQQTFRRVRFRSINAPFVAKFISDKNLMKQLTQEAAKIDNKFTYFQLVNFIKKAIGITEIQDDEFLWADFVSDFDEYCLGFVEFNDIVEWLEKMGIKTGVSSTKIKDNEDLAREKVNKTPQDYVLTEADYFRDCKTILNSEIAALKVAQQLYEQCANKPWFDSDFGPKTEARNGTQTPQYLKESRAACFGANPPAYADQIVWKYPKDFLSAEDKAKVAFLVDDASSNEVKQGQCGDCWFIGALSVVATKDHLLRGGLEHQTVDQDIKVDAYIANKMSQGIFPPIFQKFRDRGIYVLRFFKNFKWRYVLIDERLPTRDNQPEFATCSTPYEMWVPYIEKAFAKLYGCYFSLTSGFLDDGVCDMTGMVCEKIALQDKNGDFVPNDGDTRAFWNFLKDQHSNGSLMGCSVAGQGTEMSVRDDMGKPTGLLAGHAYSINDVFEIESDEDDPKFPGEKRKHRLLRIRNPWGKTEWAGKWSAQSEEVQTHKEKIEAYIKELENDEAFDIENADDGMFLINFAEWRKYYNKFFVAMDFDFVWNAVRFKCEWNKQKGTCGGCPKDKSEKAYTDFAKNPQFLFTSMKDCEVFVSLGQRDGRVGKNKNGELVFDKFPFKETMTQAVLFAYELPQGKERVTHFVNDKGHVIAQVKPTVLSEMSVRFKMTAGVKYVVLPAINQDIADHRDFFLSCYFNIDVHLMDIVCLTDPTIRYEFIPEETEKTQLIVGKWKKDLIKNETLEFMIKDSDIYGEFKLKKQRTAARKTTVKKKPIKK